MTRRRQALSLFLALPLAERLYRLLGGPESGDGVSGTDAGERA